MKTNNENLVLVLQPHVDTSRVELVSAPDPTDAAADGLHHRYASVLTRSGDVIHPQLHPLGLGLRLSVVHSSGSGWITYL